MLRASAIAAAIAVATPSLPTAARDSYARSIEASAAKHKLDPLLFVAIIHGESRFRSGLIGGLNQQCVGLGQVCLHIYPECQAGFTTEACLARRAELADPTTNIKTIGVHLAKWRTWCKQKTRRQPQPKHLLFAYGGWNNPSLNLWCGQRQKRGKWVDVASPKTLSRTLSTLQKLRRSTQGPRRRSKS